MQDVIQWLLRGDPSIVYITKRDILEIESKDDKARIGKNGWCAEYIKNQNSDGSWAKGFYQPKWTSTHYTLLELKNLCYKKNDISVQKEIKRIINEESGQDGGINPARTVMESDVCVSGMVLNYASYFKANEQLLKPIVDFILDQNMNDGGYNCNLNRYGATHSSMHSTISVIEGFQSYEKEGYKYRIDKIKESVIKSMEFLLIHSLFRSSKTREIIDDKFLRMTYPFRWKYTVVRALNYFVDVNFDYDTRMHEAIEYIVKKRTKDGFWKLQTSFPGHEYFKMEEGGQPSRMMTYLCMKILKKYPIEST